ncbi:hypothetical protein [Marinivivus vitaminiproducens]|uniref:hypothetical protein n=1 Tax=Marinivivus vitaminiproducens TaxID=3035935 RepID=UPI0027A4DDF2|nr:hypothetical protein P4R82_14555 [Geminicoccaceae bacterium SCSIO 64248]
MRSRLESVLLAMLAGLSPVVGHVALASGGETHAPWLWLAIQAVLIGFLMLREGRSPAGRTLLLGLLITAALVGWFAARGLIVATTAFAHTALYLWLLLWFARSLTTDRDVITQLARKLKGEISPEMAAYARRVTKLWCLFFAGQLGLSAALLAFAPIAAWSFFVNILDLPMVLLLFTAEYLYRIGRFGDAANASVRDTVRAFWRPQSEGA